MRSMDDPITWIIIIGFYAPLHYLLPLLVLFLTGSEPPPVRRRMMRSVLIYSSLSLVLAFAVVIALAQQGRILPAMLLLMLSMAVPFIGLWRRRRALAD